MPIFSAVADIEFANSRAATEWLIEHISNRDSTAPMDSEQLKTARRRIASTRELEKLNNTTLQQLREKMRQEQLRANGLEKMRGASSWLTTLLLKSENFVLNKRESRSTFHLHVLAARDSVSIMQCRV